MEVISNELADFLTEMFYLDEDARLAEERFTLAKRRFFEFVQAVGVEFCNFGAFDLDHGTGQAEQFAGTNLPPAFVEEYFESGLVADDYVLLRAGLLSADRPFETFNVGLPAHDRLPEHMDRTRHVIRRCADNGVEDGFAIVGNSARNPGAADSRYFGFVFAGDPASAEQARRRSRELQVAAFALLDQLRPQFAASAHGFTYNLSRREREMLADLASGRTRTQIAFHRNISVPTVDLHLRNLRAKLRAQTLAEAVAKGYLFGII